MQRECALKCANCALSIHLPDTIVFGLKFSSFRLHTELVKHPLPPESRGPGGGGSPAHSLDHERAHGVLKLLARGEGRLTRLELISNGGGLGNLTFLDVR